MGDKELVLDLLDRAYLNIMDAKNLMDDNRHFHVAGELLACGNIVNEVSRLAIAGNDD